MANNLTLDQKVNFLMNEINNINFFTKPLVVVYPIDEKYKPSDDDFFDGIMNETVFQLESMDIDSEFDKFEALFKQVFTDSQEMIDGISNFNYFFNAKLGYTYDYDSDISYFRWSNLVSYPVQLGHGHEDYFSWYRGGTENDFGHQENGFDEKVESEVTKAYELLLQKFEDFYDYIINEILNSTDVSDVKISKSESNKKRKPSPEILENTSIKLDLKRNDDLDKLLTLFVRYTDVTDDILNNAISGLHNGKKIIFKSNQNQLADFFYRLSLNGFILDNKTHISKWLCNCFDYKHSEKGISEYRNLNFDSVYRTFKGSKPVSKENRIIDDIALPVKPKKK